MDQGLANTPAGTYTPVVIYKDIAADTTLNWSNLGTGRVDEYRATLQASIAITLTGARDGQYCVLSVRQDGTGNRVITWGAEVSFTVIGGTPTLSTTAGAEDILFFIYDKALNIYRCVGFVVSSGTSTNLLNLYASGNTTLASSGVAQPGSLTFSGSNGISIGITGSKIVFYGVTGGLGTVTTIGQTAIGNTAGTTSSQTRAITAETFSGGGIVSVGFNAGTIVFSATTAQSIQTLGIYAVGNTAGTTSSATFDARTISIRGSNLISVGMSDGSLIFDATAASATSMGQTVTGNTIGLTSSQTRAITIETISGAVGASVGFSNGTLIVSAPAANTVIFSYSAPLHMAFDLSSTIGSDMSMVPMLVPAGVLTFDQVRIFLNRSLPNATLTVQTVTGNTSSSGTASAAWQGTLSLVIYRQVNSTSFQSSASASATWGKTVSWSVNRSSNSNTVTQTNIFSWMVHTGIVSSYTRSLSTSTNISSVYTFPVGLISSLSGSMRFDIPWALSLSAGQYLVGPIGSSASTVSEGASFFTASIGPNGWLNSYMFQGLNSQKFRSGPNDDQFRYYVPRGWGTTTAVGGTAPTSINWMSLSQVAGAAQVIALPMEFGLFDTN